MTPLALALVLLAAACHTCWNLIVKKAASAQHFVLLTSMLASVVWSPVLWLETDVVSRMGALQWSVLVATAVLNILYLRTLMHGYAVSDLSVVYPIARGSGPLLASIGAVALFGERLSFISACGALAVVGGVFLIAGGPRLWRRAHDPAHHKLVRCGIVWGFLTGSCIAGYSVLDAYAVNTLVVPPLLVIYVGNVLRVPMLLPFAMRDMRVLTTSFRLHWRAGLVYAVLAPLGYLLVLYAMKIAPLSHVAPAREVSMLFAALLGGGLLGEGDRTLRLAGAVCIAVGVIMLASS